MWDVVSTQTEDEWLDDYLSEILEPQLSLPAHEGSIKATSWFWYAPKPGEFFLQTDGGTQQDRFLVHELVASQLQSSGMREARMLFPKFSISYTDPNREQVLAKALRLIRTNKVHVHHNMPNYTDATVQGDHGTYHPEINRDPNVSYRNQKGIIGGSCQCDWGKFMNQPRTRVWKQYQSSPCSHLISLWWLSQAMPLESDGSQPGHPLLDTGQGDIGQFTPNFRQRINPNIPALTPSIPDTMQRSFSPDEQTPNPESALPQAPAPEAQITPVSVPGGTPQTPSNPLQYPPGLGGTFSHVIAATEFREGQMVQLREADYATTIGIKGGTTIEIPAGTVGEVLQQDAGSGMVRVLFTQGPLLGNGKLQPWGAEMWVFNNQIFPRNDLRGQSPQIRRT